MSPKSGGWLEVIVGQHLPARLGDQLDRLDEVISHRIIDEVVEVDPHPTWLDPLAAPNDFGLELV